MTTNIPIETVSVKVRGKSIKPVAARFWAKVDKHCASGCWNWTASVTVCGGYGQLNIKGKPVRANRLSWEIHFGPIPPRQCVLHRCDNPKCVNPAHLFLGTQSDNSSDMSAKGRAGSPHSKLTLEQIEKIKTLYPSVSQYKLASLMGVNQAAISRIINNQTYKQAEYARPNM